MRYSGFQPQYFPRLHYFARVLNADTFMIRDDAQFLRKHKYPIGKTGPSFQAHTPIKTANGIHLLLVPTKHEGLLSITETHISYDDNWTETHLKTLKATYSGALNFSVLYPEIEMILTSNFSSLSELNVATIFWAMLRLLGENTVTKNKLSISYVQNKLQEKKLFRVKSIRKGSESKTLHRNMETNEKIIALCKEIGADENYCGGTGAAAYLNFELFKKHGIKVTPQEWICREYPQRFMKQYGFVSNLSIIDLLMNVPYEEAVNIIHG